jgi:hypothetical protein
MFGSGPGTMLRLQLLLSPAGHVTFRGAQFLRASSSAPRNPVVACVRPGTRRARPEGHVLLRNLCGNEEVTATFDTNVLEASLSQSGTD